MSECTGFEEYKRKFTANQKIDGFGLGILIHVPCPFCAEPDFLVHKLHEAERAYRDGAVCKHCGRGLRGLFNYDASGVSFEFVQTVGVAPPDWLPTIRRDPTN